MIVPTERGWNNDCIVRFQVLTCFKGAYYFQHQSSELVQYPKMLPSSRDVFIYSIASDSISPKSEVKGKEPD
jgi:hypothetical protein